MSPEEKLDHLLDYYKNLVDFSLPDRVKTTELLMDGAEAHADVSAGIWRMYTDELLDDQLIKEIANGVYSVTLKGHLFGGYSAQKCADEALLDKLARESQTSQRNERLLVDWSRRITIATWVAAIVVAVSLFWDVWKYLHPVFSGGETTVRQIGIFF